VNTISARGKKGKANTNKIKALQIDDNEFK
jgi:hypothetical protein